MYKLEKKTFKQWKPNNVYTDKILWGISISATAI